MIKSGGLVFVSAVLGAMTLFGAVACSDDGNLAGASNSPATNTPGPTGSPGGGSSNPTPGGADPTKTTETIEGSITASRTLDSSKNWLLKGLVSVKAPATLTIQKGTTIAGDSTSKAILLIEPGAKIVAEGTADEPIVFTSP